MVGGFFALPRLTRLLKGLGWWLALLAAIALAVVFLSVLPRRYPSSSFPDSMLPPFFRDGYWAWMLAFLLGGAGVAPPPRAVLAVAPGGGLRGRRGDGILAGVGRRLG